MSTMKEARPEEIALGFLVSTLSSMKKPTTRLGLSKYSLSLHLKSALKKGILHEQVDPATGIKSYCATTEFLTQFSKARAAQVMTQIRNSMVPEEDTKQEVQHRRDNYDDRPERGNPYSGA